MRHIENLMVVSMIKKSEEIYNEVSSRIQEEEFQLCSDNTTESAASGGLSVQAKNKIYAAVNSLSLSLFYIVSELRLGIVLSVLS